MPYERPVEPSEMDISHLAFIRQNVKEAIKELATKFDAPSLTVLDVAPQDHAGVKGAFEQATVKTLDIDPESQADYIADLCVDNSVLIPSESFDLVVCAEVLEHTLRPWDAVKELARVLKPGGMLLASAPFNFRIHGPLPDCWRFTEHGWRAMLSPYFAEIEVRPLDTPDRPLMPIHYVVTARRPASSTRSA